jgi:lysophospholipid acyltransferase
VAPRNNIQTSCAEREEAWIQKQHDHLCYIGILGKNLRSTGSDEIKLFAKHGIASGYYMTFLLGGFVTAAGRLCRAHLRPLVLPPVLPSGQSQPEARYQETAPSKAKRLYDLVGSVVAVLLMNFTVAPFVIGGFYDSMETWRRMEWYGLWMVGGTLAFFSLGGKSWMQSLAHGRVSKMEKRREEETKGVRVFIPNGNTSGPHVVPPVELAVIKDEKVD